jgi:hypothetical protein
MSARRSGLSRRLTGVWRAARLAVLAIAAGAGATFAGCSVTRSALTLGRPVSAAVPEADSRTTAARFTGGFVCVVLWRVCGDATDRSGVTLCLRRQGVRVLVRVRGRLRHPHLAAVRRSLKSRSLQLLSASRSWEQAVPGGLLIPRSLVRVQHGPLKNCLHERIFGIFVRWRSRHGGCQSTSRGARPVPEDEVSEWAPEAATRRS